MSEPNKAAEYLLALRVALDEEFAQWRLLHLRCCSPFTTWREEYVWYERRLQLARDRMRQLMRRPVAEKRSGE